MPMYNLRIINACSTLCAIVLNVPPPLQVPPPLEEALLSSDAKKALVAWTAPDYSGSGCAFSAAIAADLLHSMLANIVADYQKLMIVREMQRAMPSNNVDLHYVCLLEASIECRLQDLQFRAPLGPEQHAIRLAMLIYSCIPLIAATGPTAVLSQTLACKIRSNLERTDLKSCWAPFSDILLWILVIGSFVSYQENQWSWFQSSVSELLSLMGVTSLLDMESRLRRCYYCRYLTSITKVLWTSVEEAAVA
jgi:hypothetical protein